MKIAKIAFVIITSLFVHLSIAQNSFSKEGFVYMRNELTKKYLGYQSRSNMPWLESDKGAEDIVELLKNSNNEFRIKIGGSPIGISGYKETSYRPEKRNGYRWAFIRTSDNLIAFYNLELGLYLTSNNNGGFILTEDLRKGSKWSFHEAKYKISTKNVTAGKDKSFHIMFYRRGHRYYLADINDGSLITHLHTNHETDRTVWYLEQIADKYLIKNAKTGLNLTAVDCNEESNLLLTSQTDDKARWEPYYTDGGSFSTFKNLGCQMFLSNNLDGKGCVASVRTYKSFNRMSTLKDVTSKYLGYTKNEGTVQKDSKVPFGNQYSLGNHPSPGRLMYTYGWGRVVKGRMYGDSQIWVWQEKSRADGSIGKDYEYTEDMGLVPGYYILRSNTNAKSVLKIPVNGGMAYLSSDHGKNFREWDVFKKEYSTNVIKNSNNSSNNNQSGNNSNTNTQTVKVDGRNVKVVQYSGGYFVNTAGKTWKECSNANGSFTFLEQNRDQWSVYLFDSSRNINIQLDLWKKVIYIGKGGGKSKLYSITKSHASNVKTGCGQ